VHVTLVALCLFISVFLNIIAATNKTKTDEKKDKEIDTSSASAQQSPSKDRADVLTGNVNSQL